MTPLWRPDLYDGAWLIQDYEGVCRALRDPRLLAARTGDWLRGGASAGLSGARRHRVVRHLMAQAIIFQDGPSHARLRSVLQPALVMARLEGLRERLPQWVREAWGTPSPAETLSLKAAEGLLGLDAESLRVLARDLSPLSELLVAPRASALLLDRAQTAVERHLPMLQSALRESEGGPLTLIQQGDLSETEKLAQALVLIVATTETVRRMLVAVVECMEKQRRGGDFADASAAQVVREVLRMQAPVPITARRVGMDLNWGEATLLRGQAVVLDIAAACRDPLAWERPDEFNPHRDQRPLPVFGLGPHACVGAALSRMCAEALIRAEGAEPDSP